MVILGLVFSMISLYVGAPDIRHDIGVYLSFSAFFLVIGGTFASTMISSSKTEMKSLFRIFGKLFGKKKSLQSIEAIDVLVRIAELAQTKNKKDLIKEGEGVGDGFLQNALILMGSGLEPDFIDQTLETNILEIQRRHTAQINMVRTMGSYAPMFGMAGTVIGVIQVLKNVTDIENIVSGMALALLTTLYGLFLSSILFIPLANKLRGMSDKEILTKEIIREGVLMILEKEIPLKVKSYLSAFVEKSALANEKKKAQ